MVRLLDLTDSLGIQAQCLGELVVFAAIGLPLGGALARAVGRTGAAHRRPIAVLILLSVALALFAIVVDLVHITFIRAFFGSRLVLEVLEEGGEMLTLSLAFAHVLATWLAEPRARGRLGPEPAAA